MKPKDKDISMPKGSNAKPKHKGFQPVVDKPAKAPVTSNKLDLDNVKSKKDEGAEIALKGSVDSHYYDSLVAKAKSRSKYPILSKEDYMKAFDKYKVPQDVARKASNILSKNPPLLVAASGKMASGKDTIIL